MDTLEYLDPVSPNLDKKLYVPAVGDLRGKRIAFVSNGWKSFDAIGRVLDAGFTARFGTEGLRTYSIPTSCAPEPGLLERIALECDAAIVGMAN
jgi:hypothetical protein